MTHQNSMHESFIKGRVNDPSPAGSSFQPSMLGSTRAEVDHEIETDLVLFGAAVKLERFGHMYRTGEISRKTYLSEFAKVARALQSRFPQDIVIDTD